MRARVANAAINQSATVERQPTAVNMQLRTGRKFAIPFVRI